MTESPNAISPDAPSPWWPCPECGGLEMRTAVLFERGWWVTEDVWTPFDPPAGRPTTVVLSDVECRSCGHVFDIGRHYGWPIVGEYEAT